MDYSVRTLSPQESRVVLALAEQKRREVGRPEIIKLLGVSAKAADNVIESCAGKVGSNGRAGENTSSSPRRGT